MLLALLGNYAALKIQQRFNLSCKIMIFMTLCGYSMLSGLGLMGLIPGSPIGLKSVPEAFLFATIHGLCIGAVQSYSRTMMSDLLISGKESEFFALYEITDKGSSWLGPLVVGEIYRATGVHQYAFVYLIMMTLAPAIFLLTVDLERGMKEVRAVLCRDAEVIDSIDVQEDTRGTDAGVAKIELQQTKDPDVVVSTIRGSG